MAANEYLTTVNILIGVAVLVVFCFLVCLCVGLIFYFRTDNGNEKENKAELYRESVSKDESILNIEDGKFAEDEIEMNFPSNKKYYGKGKSDYSGKIDSARGRKQSYESSGRLDSARGGGHSLESGSSGSDFINTGRMKSASDRERINTFSTGNGSGLDVAVPVFSKDPDFGHNRSLRSTPSPTRNIGLNANRWDAVPLSENVTGLNKLLVKKNGSQSQYDGGDENVESNEVNEGDRVVVNNPSFKLHRPLALSLNLIDSASPRTPIDVESQLSPSSPPPPTTEEKSIGLELSTGGEKGKRNNVRTSFVKRQIDNNRLFDWLAKTSLSPVDSESAKNQDAQENQDNQDQNNGIEFETEDALVIRKRKPRLSLIAGLTSLLEGSTGRAQSSKIAHSQSNNNNNNNNNNNINSSQNPSPPPVKPRPQSIVLRSPNDSQMQQIVQYGVEEDTYDQDNNFDDVSFRGEPPQNAYGNGNGSSKFARKYPGTENHTSQNQISQATEEQADGYEHEFGERYAADYKVADRPESSRFIPPTHPNYYRKSDKAKQTEVELVEENNNVENNEGNMDWLE